MDGPPRLFFTALHVSRAAAAERPGSARDGLVGHCGTQFARVAARPRTGRAFSPAWDAHRPLMRSFRPAYLPPLRHRERGHEIVREW